MHNTIRFIIIGITTHLFLMSCERSSSTGAASAENDSIVASEKVIGNYLVDSELSVVAWQGRVIGVYGHNGVINIKEGFLETKGDEITSGTIVINMKSIVPLDSGSYRDREGSRITDLQEHLTTGDFFLTEEYPTASFEIKSQQNNKLTGDLTIRGITHEETAILSYLEILPEGLSGDGILVFDRQKYGIKWKHAVTDYVLSDEIEVKLSIVARISENIM